MNSIKAPIQFKIEEETASTLSFLDTRITHHSDGFSATTIFRGQTNIWTSSHTVYWHTKWRRYAHCFIGLRGSVLISPKRKMRRNMWHNTPQQGLPQKPSDQTLVSHSHLTHNPDQVTPTAIMTLPYICHLPETIRKAMCPSRRLQSMQWMCPMQSRGRNQGW